MRPLLLCLAIVPACASAPSPVPMTEATAVAPVEELAPPSNGTYYPPYALMFHEGQQWTFPVEAHGVLLAMTSPSSNHDGMVTCRVEHVDYFCDRRVSNVSCDDGNHVVAGVYTANMQGLWRNDFAASTEQLTDDTRVFARAPREKTVETAELTLQTKRYGSGWCSTQVVGGSDETICVADGKGLIGGSFIDGDKRIFIGDVPHS